MKKIFALILVLLMAALVFTACDDNKDPKTTTEDVTTTTTENTTTTTTEENTTSTTEEETTTLPVVTVDENVKAALDYIYNMYKAEGPATPTNLTRLDVATGNGKKFSVEWRVEITKGAADSVKVIAPAEGSHDVIIEVPSKTAEDIEYKLIASIKNDKGETQELTFEYNVPAFKVNTWEEYAALGNNENVVVKGIVTGIMADSKGNTGNNCLYFQDNNGGYYAYRIDKDPVTEYHIEVGMTVLVTGKKDNYNGTLEIKEGTVEILNNGEKTPVTPVDYTEIYKNAGALTDVALAGKQGLLVTVKGVTVGGVGDNGYYYFELNGKQTYVRISSSVCPITKDEQATFIKNHADHRGWTADVTGVICVYNDAFYLSPVSVDAFSNFVLPEKTDAEKVAIEKENLTFTEKVVKDTVFDLELVGKTYDSVTIAWASDNALAVVENGKLTVTLADTETTVKLKATITSGEVTDVKEFTVIVSKKGFEITSITELIALVPNSGDTTTDKYYAKGQIVEIQNDKYGNVIIEDAEGNQLLVYGMYSETDKGGNRYDSMAVKPAVGDIIVVYGAMKNYNGKPEIVDTWLAEHYVMTSYADLSNLVPNAGDVTTDKYFTVGKVVEVQNAKYGNLLIEDADGNKLLVYGMYSEKDKGGNRYDSMAVKPAVGDTVVVYGAMKNYNGTVEIVDTWLVMLKAGTPDGGEDVGGGDDTPAGFDPTGKTEAEILEAAFALGDNEAFTAPCTLTGEITVISYAYNAQYNNITVLIKVADKEIECFRLKGGEGLAVGDKITVTGTIKNYKKDDATPAKIEFDAGATYVLDGEGGDIGGDTPAALTGPTMAYSGTTTSNMAGDGTDVTTLGLDAAKFEVTCDPCGYANNYGGSSNPGLNKDGSIRLYASADGNGCEITVSVKEGTIARIAVNALTDTKNGKTANGVFSILVNDTAVEAANGVYVINATSFTIKNVTQATSNTQVWIGSITIELA